MYCHWLKLKYLNIKCQSLVDQYSYFILITPRSKMNSIPIELLVIQDYTIPLVSKDRICLIKTNAIFTLPIVVIRTFRRLDPLPHNYYQALKIV
jgi:hypothetical protein